MQMMRECYPMLSEEAPVLVDWLPWNHVFGGTVSFCIALYNGGTLYIDDGKPLPGQIEKTVGNLREVAPLFYSNVPKGYEELIPWLRRDRALRENFFSRVRILQYSGASIAQHVCDAFDELARKTIGCPIPWVALLGSTEAGLTHGTPAFGGRASRMRRPSATRRHAQTHTDARQTGTAGSKPMRHRWLLAARRSHFRRLRRRRFSANRRCPAVGGCRKSATRLPLRRTRRGGLQAGDRHMGPCWFAQSASLAAFDGRTARRGDRRRKPGLHRRLGHSILAGDCARRHCSGATARQIDGAGGRGKR
jgi:acyl-CoA synthetase (AMP-forming)/AMP-acid ligase II